MATIRRWSGHEARALRLAQGHVMDLRFHHYNAESAEGILDTVIAPLYEASHADISANRFYSTERAVERTRGYLRAPGFALVVAYIEDDAIGQAFGYPLPATTRWWTGLTTPVAGDLIKRPGRGRSRSTR